MSEYFVILNWSLAIADWKLGNIACAMIYRTIEVVFYECASSGSLRSYLYSFQFRLWPMKNLIRGIGER